MIELSVAHIMLRPCEKQAIELKIDGTAISLKHGGGQQGDKLTPFSYWPMNNE